MASFYFTENARHALRYYCKYLSGPARTRRNWYAVHRVFQRLSDAERDTLIQIYKDGEATIVAVLRLSRERGIAPRCLWDLVERVERAVAKELDRD